MPQLKKKYKLPGNINEKLKLQENKQKCPIARLTKLREAVRLRKDKATELFLTGLFGVSRCIWCVTILIHYTMEQSLTF